MTTEYNVTLNATILAPDRETARQCLVEGLQDGSVKPSFSPDSDEQTFAATVHLFLPARDVHKASEAIYDLMDIGMETNALVEWCFWRADDGTYPSPKPMTMPPLLGKFPKLARIAQDALGVGELFTDRELATMLAALRYWQRWAASRDSDPIATDCGTLEPLENDEIDVLCERLNEGG